MRAGEGGPAVGHTENDTLGVRETVVLEDGREAGDIKAVEGVVSPQTGGMSVSPGKEDLPPHLIPKRHRGRYLAARRGNTKPETFPWRMGAGPFVAGPVSAKLQLRPGPDDASHGFIEPDRAMPLDEYRGAIEATRPEWVQEQW
jgi:hypothetical protein